MDSILSYGEKFMNDQDNQEEKIERQKKFLSILGDVNFQDRSGFSPLHFFMMKGDGDGVRLILRHSEAKLDLKTQKGRSALHWASDEGH